MTAPLCMISVPARLSKLALYADDRGWTRRKRADGHEADASFDAGRALHHVLDETFGPSALKPFRLMVSRDRDRGSVYAYSAHTKAELLAVARETSMPEVASILDLDRLEDKVLPLSWMVGRRLGFDVLVRPTVRLHSELTNPRKGQKAYVAGAEINAYVAEAGRSHPGDAPPSGMAVAGRSREAVYRDWLAARMAPAALLVEDRTTMVAYERQRLARAGNALDGPVATFHGELTVADASQFTSLLARGIGRHRSFGFGMLLLKPLRRG